VESIRVGCDQVDMPLFCKLFETSAIKGTLSGITVVGIPFLAKISFICGFCRLVFNHDHFRVFGEIIYHKKVVFSSKSEVICTYFVPWSQWY